MCVGGAGVRGLLAGTLQLSFTYDTRGGCERVVEVAAPTRDGRAQLAHCRLRLERAAPEQAVCGVAVLVQPCDPRP